MPLANDLVEIGEVLRRHLGQRPCCCRDALTPRSRMFDTANHHLDGLTILQAGIDRELNGLPMDHTFYGLSHAGPPSMSNAPVVPAIGQTRRLRKLPV
jgi:hypothetical protein